MYIKKIKDNCLDEVNEWIEDLPKCQTFHYLLFCFNEIGMLTDEIVKGMDQTVNGQWQEELIKWRTKTCERFTELIFKPPKLGEFLKWEKRAGMIMKVCVLLGFWHEYGDEILFLYEFGYREWVQKEIQVKLPSAKDTIETFKNGEILETLSKYTEAKAGRDISRN